MKNHLLKDADINPGEAAALVGAAAEVVEQSRCPVYYMGRMRCRVCGFVEGTHTDDCALAAFDAISKGEKP